MRVIVAALLMSSVLGGCAHTQSAKLGDLHVAERDPYEKINRKLYSVNRTLDRYALKPVAQGYRAVVPEAGRRGVSNFFANLHEPIYAINAVLQGKFKSAFHALGRFVINTTIGVGGIADNATKLGVPAQPHDFGQTLAVYGVKAGPYVMLPVIGPNTVRDAGGFAIDSFVLDPIPYGERRLISTAATYAVFGLRLVDIRSRLLDQGDNLLKGSADEYATVRSAFLQYRRNELYDGNPPDQDDDPAVGPAAPATGAPTSRQDPALTAPAGTAPPPSPAPPVTAPPSPTSEPLAPAPKL